MMKESIYTLMVFTENKSGVQSRVVGLITRRKINIETLTVSRSSIKGIHRFTIAVVTTAEVIRKLTDQIDKQVDVIKAYYYTDEEIAFQEIALYKIPTAVAESTEGKEVLRRHHARIMEINTEYVVVEMTGHASETEQLLEELRPLGLYEFVRSGRVAVARPMERLNKYLKEMNVEIETIQ